MKNVVLLLSACGLVLSIGFVSGDEKKDGDKPAAKIELKDVKCPVSGKGVKEASTRDYKGGKVFFCCDNCPKAFDKQIKTNAQFQANANLQLVATKQATQEKCPITGRELDKTKTEKVDGVTVTFCCAGCQGKVAKADAKEKTALVFSDAAFKKGFKAPADKKDDKKNKKD